MVSNKVRFLVLGAVLAVVAGYALVAADAHKALSGVASAVWGS